MRQSVCKIFVGALAVLIQTFALVHADEKFPLVDSEYWILSAGSKSIFWFDDRRILFIGRDPKVPKADRDAAPELLLWEIGKAATIVRRGVDWLCYSRGQIAYAVRDTQSKTRPYYQGELGKEIRVESKNISLINCDMTHRPPDRSENRMVKQLLHGHGYLYLGPIFGAESSENTPVFLVREGESQRVQLPFGRRELSVTEYYEFKKSYFVRLSYFDPSKGIGPTTWPLDLPQKTYWLSPDGKTERLDIPGDISGPIPTKLGIAYRVFGTNTSKDGIYLMTSDTRRALVYRGYVTQIALSPDGCQLAFSHAPDRDSDGWRPKSSRTLKVANLCMGAKK